MASSKRYLGINRETGMIVRWNGQYTTRDRFWEIHRWVQADLYNFLRTHPDKDKIEVVLFEE